MQKTQAKSCIIIVTAATNVINIVCPTMTTATTRHSGELWLGIQVWSH